MAKAKASPGLIGRDLVREVVPRESSSWELGLDRSYLMSPIDADGQHVTVAPAEAPPGAWRPHVVALDFGMKRNILRHLVSIGCKVTVMPGSATAQAILEMQPDGIFISNGPGDPRPLTEATDTMKTLTRAAAEDRGIPI